MIRFSCRKCGKSLRANESIIGRSSRCTACRAINRVPSESTRKSGEKSERASAGRPPAPIDALNDFDEAVVTLIADSDSDSFEGFENLDFAQYRINTESATNLNRLAQPNGGSSAESNRAPLPSSSAPAVQQPTATGFNLPPAASKSEARFDSPRRTDFWQPVNPTIPPIVGLTMAGVCLLAFLGYGGYRYFASGPSIQAKTQLELSAVGNGYGQAMFELKKAKRVLDYLETAYLQKKLPESGLAATRSLREEFNQLTNNPQSLTEANRRFDSGDVDGAQQLLNQQIDLMANLKGRLDQETSVLKLKVFGR
jgi:hypothetical protein